MDVFYESLAPHGDWVDVEGYGYCFRPAVTLNDPSWRPYTEGSWIYTDAGWTWQSDEDFGWATYHYGRWTLIQNQWLWVPGDVWAPAWVSWRADDEYIGWAPLPPEAVWNQDTGFTEYVDVNYDIGPAYYSFVPVHFLGERNLRRHIEPWQRNVDYMRRTQNYTRITYRSTNNHLTSVFNEGPDYTRFARSTDNPIRRMDLAVRADTDFRDPHKHHRNTAENNSFRVIAPIVSLAGVSRDSSRWTDGNRGDGRDGNRGPAPANVKQRFDRTKVDHGWNGFRQEEVSALRSEIQTKSRDVNREASRDINRTTVTGDRKPMEQRKGETPSLDRVTGERNTARPGDKDDVRKAIPAGPGQNRPDERTGIRPDENQREKMQPVDPNRNPSKGPDRFRESPPQTAPPRSQVGPRSGGPRPDDTPPGPRKALPGEDSGNSQRPDRNQDPKMKTDREKQNDSAIPRPGVVPPTDAPKIAPGEANPNGPRPDRGQSPKMKTDRPNENAVPRAGVVRPDDAPPGPSRKMLPGEDSGNSQRPDRNQDPKMKTDREKQNDNAVPRPGVVPPTDAPKIAPGEPNPNSQRSNRGPNPKMKTDRPNENAVPRAGVVRPDDNPPGPSRTIAPGLSPAAIRSAPIANQPPR